MVSLGVVWRAHVPGVLCLLQGLQQHPGKSIELFREAIDHFPLVDTPEVFGLHPNADIT